MKETYSQQDLIDFQPQHDLFIGVDSDGCVFDSMTVKQRVFHDCVIEFWELESAADEVREICEWVGLFSPWRGLNRFQLVLKMLHSLNEGGVGLMNTKSLEAFVNSGVPLSMTELKKRIEQTGDADLEKIYNWSAEASRRIAELAEMPVFDGVEEGLAKMRKMADAIVVSQTTEEALVREWRNAELECFIDVIAGAELGSKAESLTRAAVDRYPLDRILMMGDATGDLEAARTIGCLFFPIIPGDEVASWVELRDVAFNRMRNGTFAGAYQDELIARFTAALSPVPPWNV